MIEAYNELRKEHLPACLCETVALASITLFLQLRKQEMRSEEQPEIISNHSLSPTRNLFGVFQHLDW